MHRVCDSLEPTCESCRQKEVASQALGNPLFYTETRGNRKYCGRPIPGSVGLVNWPRNLLLRFGKFVESMTAHVEYSTTEIRWSNFVEPTSWYTVR